MIKVKGEKEGNTNMLNELKLKQLTEKLHENMEEKWGKLVKEVEEKAKKEEENA